MFVVIGTVTADLLLKSETALSTLGGDGFRSSNLVFTDAPLNISMGGNGGNSAYALAGLGVPTALCGAVGDDLLGNWLAGLLQERGVRLEGLLYSRSHATSTSTILMSDAANQVVFHHLGATTQASYETIPETLLDRAEVLLATSFSIMPQMRSDGFAQALRRVHERGGITALDIGPAIGEPVTLAELQPLFPYVDYLIGNQHEIISLTRCVGWRDAALKLLEQGTHCVVVKQGSEGSCMMTSAREVHMPAFAVKTNISVGAGDSFNVGFLYGLQQGWDWEDALRFANATAALVVSNLRAILDSPTLGQVERFLALHQ